MKNVTQDIQKKTFCGFWNFGLISIELMLVTRISPGEMQKAKGVWFFDSMNGK
jgi:hypothetical protein